MERAASSIWGAVSRAVRVPTRFDTDLRFRFPGSTALLLTGSPAFKSENVIAYEAGYRQQFHERLSVDIATYVNRYDDLRTQEFAPGRPITLAEHDERTDARRRDRPPPCSCCRGGKCTRRTPISGRSSRSIQAARDPTRGTSEANDPRNIFKLRSYINADQAHRDRRVLPLRRHSCRSRPSMPIASSTCASATASGPGWDLSLIGTNLLHDRHRRVPRRHRAGNLRALGDAAIGMAFLSVRAARVAGRRGRRVPERRRVPRAQTPAAPIEANVKAVFLFNFAKYVTWPPVNLGERSPAEVRVCVTANDAFFALTEVRRAGRGHRRQTAACRSRLKDWTRRGPARFSTSAIRRAPDAKAWLSAVRGAQVLTVADGALNDDTVIAFVRDEQPHSLRHQPRVGQPPPPERQLQAAAPGATGEGPVMLNRLSIRQKLTAMLMMRAARCCCSRRRVCDLGLLPLSRRHARPTLRRRRDWCSTTPRAAVTFKDPEAADETLEMLSINPHVQIACLYLPTGPLFTPRSFRCPRPTRHLPAFGASARLRLFARPRSR